jgi:hypothetical protein
MVCASAQLQTQYVTVAYSVLVLVPNKSDRDYISDAATRWRFC